jgi:hypothetical protein
LSFIRKPLTFSLKDIGSTVIDQLSTDIYSGPRAILRELTKNAYDSYLPLTQDDFDDEGLTRAIIVSRDRTGKLGRITVADQGVGQNMQDLKANVQISISRKAGELENATGFRGLGSWASLGAGSKIVITSHKRNDTKRNRLTINVREIYKRMGPDATLHDILNDAKCLFFEEEVIVNGRHGTSVEIQCDGPTERVGRYEMNRLYAFTDPKNEEIRDILIASCPLPFTSEGGAYPEIHKLYQHIGYIPTKVLLDGDELVKRLPKELTIQVEELKHGTTTAAWVWTASDPKKSGGITAVDPKYMLGTPGIQLLRLNVPIGPKNLFGDNIRATTPAWYFGEVHVVLPDVLPDAGGEGLRAGTARAVFIDILQKFYTKLEDAAEEKSERISLGKHLEIGIKAAEMLSSGKPIANMDKVRAETAVAKAVELIQATSTPGRGATLTAQRRKQVLKDADLKKVRSDARKILKEKGYLAHYSKPKAKSKGRKSVMPVGARGKSTIDIQSLSVPDLQARLGEALPQFEALGLSNDQIDGVLEIIIDCIQGES